MSKVTHLTPERGSDRAPPKAEGAGRGETTGESLRAARLRRGDDLAAASRALCIRKDLLQSLEEDRPDDLPGRTYAIGFVRSYSGYLGLDPAEQVERFKRENAGRGDGTPQIGFLAEPEPLALPYGRIAMTVLVALVLVYGGYYLFRSAGTRATQPVAPVPARMALASAPNPQPLRTRARRSAQPSTPAANGVVAQSAISGNLVTQLANLPHGQIFGNQNKNVRVVLHARSATHVLVQGPGGRVFINRILHPGDAYRVPNLVGLQLTTPDGGAVVVELDGQQMGLAGHAGQMTEALSIDPQAIVDRTNAAKRG